jgi:ubiquinone/menaquinone biosynthesis C-methylase UbiE
MVQTEDVENPDDYYAQTYDDSVPDWPGEIEFYLGLADQVKAKGGRILELACGTGRVAIRLARPGVEVVGLDHSAEMIQKARQKSADIQNIRWVQGDMRSFQLDEQFDMVIIPGHSFQNLNIARDQVACLESVKSHLSPGGKFVVHLDHMNLDNVGWLGDLCGELAGAFEVAEEFTHPQSGNRVKASRAWWYHPSTQTAIVRSAWEEYGSDAKLINRIERQPVHLHCVFRFEMEHLLARVGFQVDALYGSFFRDKLLDESNDMIWVATY